MNKIESAYIIQSNYQNSELLCNVLLQYGIAAKTALNFSFAETLDELKSNQYDLIVLDFDFSNQKSMDFLEELKKEQLQQQYFIIGTSFHADSDLIKKLMNFSLIGFIIKPLNQEKIAARIKNILKKFTNQYQEKRKHIRITPDRQDLITASFVLKTKKRLSAKVLNISMSGIAIELYKNYEHMELKKGKLLEHLTFNTLTKEVNVDGLITNKKEKFITLKFTHFYHNSYEHLSRYIMKNISF